MLADAARLLALIMRVPFHFSISLVTLSGCETGISEIKPGDELFGLMRALIYAGAPSILMSLWNVNDISTALLMTRFYVELNEGKNKIEALQTAQNYVRTLTLRELVESYRRKVASLSLTQLDRLDVAITHLERYTARLKEKGDTYQPFTHPYYWAPFILLGDWQ